MADLNARLTDAEQAAAQTRTESDRFEARRRARDRSFIANLVVIAFVGLIILVTGRALWSSWKEMKEPAEFVLKLLSSVLLPVVTLVIGYYFGKKGA